MTPNDLFISFIIFYHLKKKIQYQQRELFVIGQNSMAALGLVVSTCTIVCKGAPGTPGTASQNRRILLAIVGEVKMY